MLTALIIMFPISLVLVGFLVLKSVQLGLKWQIQTEQNKEPTLTIPNPIKEHIESNRANKQAQFTNDVMDEWLNGPKEGG